MVTLPFFAAASSEDDVGALEAAASDVPINTSNLNSVEDIFSVEIPTDSVPVSTWAQLSSAMGDPSVSHIHLIADVRRGGSAVLPAIQRSLVIDGQNHIIDGRGGSGAPGAGTQIGPNSNLFRMNTAGVTTRESLTVQNARIFHTAPTGLGGRMPAFATVSSASATTEAWTRNNAASFNWTLNLRNVVGNAAITSSGANFLSLSDGTVNFAGTNSWLSGGDHIPVNVRQINVIDGNTTIGTTGAAGDDWRIGIRMWPAVASRGVGITVSGGGKFNVSNNTSNHTINMSAEGSQLAGPAHIVVTGDGSELNTSASNVTDNAPRGGRGATILLRATSGGVSVTDGGALNVTGPTNTGNRGAPALLQEIPGGTFLIDGENSRVDVRGRNTRTAEFATLEFRQGANQNFHVRNGGELYVFRDRAAGDTTARAGAAVSLHNAQFEVSSGGKVYIENMGRNTAMNPTTNVRAGDNAALEFAANGFGFRVMDENSDVTLIAHRGSALNAGNRSNGHIEIGPGAAFTARGRTATADGAIFMATGGNNHFVMNNPLFYDFANMRPGTGTNPLATSGGRVFALGAASGTASTNSSFTSSESDVSVWIRGRQAWDAQPERSWLGIDYRLTGLQLRSATSNNPNFLNFYNEAPNSQRVENYTRIMANNAAPQVVEPAFTLTNADRHVRMSLSVPEGRDRIGRPIQDNEAWGTFQVEPASGGAAYVVSSAQGGSENLRSFARETLYEVQTDIQVVSGTLRLSPDNSDYLLAGDTYTLIDLWRSFGPDDVWRHTAFSDMMGMPMTVEDVVPPVPAELDTPIIYTWTEEFTGVWSFGCDYDNGPVVGTEGIKAYVQAGGFDSGGARPLSGTGEVFADGTWAYSPEPGQLQSGDMVYLVLVDDQGNENPLIPTPYRDMLIPAAPFKIVAGEEEAPYVVFYHFDGAEDRNRAPFHVGTTMWRGPGTFTPVTYGEDFPSAPAEARVGYRLDRVDPGMTTNIDREVNVIRVFYVLDEGQRVTIPLEFRFNGEVHSSHPDGKYFIEPQVLGIVQEDDISLSNISEDSAPRGFVPYSQRRTVPEISAEGVPAADLEGRTIRVNYATTWQELNVAAEIRGDDADTSLNMNYALYLFDAHGEPMPEGTELTWMLHIPLLESGGDTAEENDSEEEVEEGGEDGADNNEGGDGDPDPETGVFIVGANGRLNFSLGHMHNITIGDIRSDWQLQMKQERLPDYSLLRDSSFEEYEAVDSWDTGRLLMDNSDGSFLWVNQSIFREIIPTGASLGGLGRGIVSCLALSAIVMASTGVIILVARKHRKELIRLSSHVQ